jgi:hypothetical protein
LFPPGHVGAFGLKSEQQLMADRMVPNSTPLAPPHVPPLVERFVEGVQSPFRVLIMLGVPTVGFIGYRAFQSKLIESSGRTSMAFMHTRIVGQITVVGILIGLMIFSGNGPMDVSFVLIEALSLSCSRVLFLVERTKKERSSGEMNSERKGTILI